MRLPLIKSLLEEDYYRIKICIDVLERFIGARGIKEEELDVLGELLSNLEGATEVIALIQDNKISKTEALNTFMKRVTTVGQ